jgi:hypothetical protein
MSNRAKVTKFSFSLPIPKISKAEGLFSVGSAGQIDVFAKALIAPELQDLPLVFAESKEVRIFLESAVYQKIDILPVLQLPEAKLLLASIHRAAYNTLLSIQNA